MLALHTLALTELAQAAAPAFLTVPLKRRAPLTIEQRIQMERSVKVGYTAGAPTSIVINDYQDAQVRACGDGAARNASHTPPSHSSPLTRRHPRRPRARSTSAPSRWARPGNSSR